MDRLNGMVEGPLKIMFLAQMITKLAKPIYKVAALFFVCGGGVCCAREKIREKKEK